MSLISKMFSAFGYERVTKQPRAYVTPMGMGSEGMGAPTPQNYSTYLKQYADAPWIYSCVYRIASKGSGVPWKLYKKIKKNNKITYDEIMSHPIIDLLDKVNPYMTGDYIKLATISYEELTGNAYWLLDSFVSGKPTEIFPLRPDRVTIIPSKTDFIAGYKYNLDQGKYLTFKPEQIIHFKYFNSNNDFYGLSPLAAAREAVNIQKAGDSYNANLLNNQAIPGGALISQTELGTDSKRQILHAWKSMHQGKSNAGRIAILDGGLDWKAVGLSTKDIDFIQAKKMTREDILGVFGVPPAVVGIFEYANYANSKEQREIFWRDTMMPKLNMIASTINEFLIKPMDDTLELAFDYADIDALQVDEELKARVDQTLINSGIKTINEAREERGLKPVPWGNVWNAPMNLIPIGSTPKPVESPTPPVQEQTPEPIVKEEIIKDRCEQVDKEAQRKKIESLLNNSCEHIEEEEIDHTICSIDHDLYVKEQEIDHYVEPMKLEDATCNENLQVGYKMEPADDTPQVAPQVDIAKEIRTKYWFKFKELTETWEKKFIPVLQKEFKVQRAETLANLEDEGLKYAPSEDIKRKDKLDIKIERILFDNAEANKAMKKVTKPLIEDTLEANALEQISDLDLGLSFDVTNQAVQDVINARTANLVTQVNNTTRDALKDTIRAGVAAGESIPEITDRINYVFDVADSSRATTIARTEVIGASNEGAFIAYEQSDVVEEKEWISARDNDVRGADPEKPSDYDHNIDGERVKLDEPFSNGLMYPGDPSGAPGNVINCRCTMKGVVNI